MTARKTQAARGASKPYDYLTQAMLSQWDDGHNLEYATSPRLKRVLRKLVRAACMEIQGPPGDFFGGDATKRKRADRTAKALIP